MGRGMEPAEVKDLIDEAVERTERADDAADAHAKVFRDRVSLLVGCCAVALAIIHVEAAGANRTSVASHISASDSYSYMQAKIIRETVLTSAAKAPGVAATDKAAMLVEAHRLRAPDKAGHGIGQLQKQGDAQQEQAQRSAERSERFELGETALQVAIVLLSVALIAQSVWVVAGAALLAGAGVLIALLTYFAAG